jgi:hypothetical protein
MASDLAALNCIIAQAASPAYAATAALYTQLSTVVCAQLGVGIWNYTSH